MFKNYMKIAFRNIRRYKGFSFINIAGLAVGMACCILILLWVQDELSYETQHRNAHRIYQVNKKYSIGDKVDYNPSTPYPLATALKEKFAETEFAMRIVNSTTLMKYNDKIFNERVCFTDSTIFRILTYQFLKGDPLTALSHPNSVVLTEELSRKYFGDEDPMGKKLIVNNRDEFAVTGVVENIQSNTELRHAMFAPLSYKISPDNTNDWGSHRFGTFVLLKEGADVQLFESKMTALIKENLPKENLALELQSLKDMHLYSVSGEPVRMKYVYFFSLIALFVLAIASINYTNLSTARASRRAKEVGIRKVVGAGRKQLMVQFFGESVLYTGIALIVAVIIVKLFMPAFNDLTGKALTLGFSNYALMAYMVLIAACVSLFSGSYPAVFLSSLIPVKVLKGNTAMGMKGSNFRRALVIIQFSLAVIVIVGTIVINSQLSYMRNRDLGVNTDNLMYLRLNREVSKNFDVFKNSLLKNPDILSVARTSELPTETWSIMRGITWAGKSSESGTAFGLAAVDFDYVKTLNLKIVMGRNFSDEFPSDSSAIIVNQKAIEVMGMKEPIGKKVGDGEESIGHIIGVVEDFNFLPLTYEMEPFVMMILPDYYDLVLVKISGDNVPAAVSSISDTWKELSPNFPFEHHFVDERFERMYNDEIRAGKLFGYFVFLAITISCLGLFGLASFMAEQRTKEIGIRKILGSSVSAIILLSTKEFVYWVLIANLIAWPIAYYAMHQWLQDFAYRVDMGIGMFILSGLIAMGIALATVGYQAVKSATANPINSLRYE